MFSIEKLGLIAYLNDNSRLTLNRLFQELPEDIVEDVFDSHISGRRTVEKKEGLKALAALNEKPIPKDVLHRTIDRIKSYQNNGVSTVTYWDSSYPVMLKQIPNPPLIMYVNGNKFPGNKPIAIVGTRNPSSKGLQLSYEFGAKLAIKGHTIISGLARGIDAQAHAGALEVNGTTIAVLGTPITEIYPEENKELAKEIMNNGALVSEITEEAYMHPGRFVIRNRITSGLSSSVIVIESSGQGGTYRQVELALKQHRKVYVVNQGVFSNPEHRAGYRKLIEKGATPTESPEDIVPQDSKQLKLF